MRAVLFLGAGFSVPFGLPAMGGFNGHVQGLSDQLISSELREELRRALLDARQANSFLSSDPKNLEDILSFAQMRNRLEDSEESKARAESIRKLLGIVYSQFPEPLQLKRLADAFHNALSRAPTNALQAIVTTNYDLNIELLANEAGITVQLAGEGLKVTGSGPGVQGGVGVPIYKLHGAVNWWESGDGTVTADASGRNGIFRTSSGNRQHFHFNANDQTHKSHSIPPLIVPPSFLKPELHKVMRGIWANAAREMGCATDLVFIGYSFPETDTEMRYFLAHALTKNTELQNIWIVDPNAEEIVERLKRGHYGNHFASLLVPETRGGDSWEAKLHWVFL